MRNLAPAAGIISRLYGQEADLPQTGRENKFSIGKLQLKSLFRQKINLLWKKHIKSLNVSAWLIVS